MSREAHQSCIDACLACAEACERCAAACRKEPEGSRLAHCLALNTDCADFCRLTAAFLTRDSEFNDLVREDCAEICKACEDECKQHPLAECRACADACHHCAALCLEIAA